MSIISTTVTQDAHTQTDGRRYMVEVHTFSTGETVTVGYLAAAGTDAAAIAASRIAVLEQAMAESEAQAVLNG